MKDEEQKLGERNEQSHKQGRHECVPQQKKSPKSLTGPDVCKVGKAL